MGNEILCYGVNHIPHYQDITLHNSHFLTLQTVQNIGTGQKAQIQKHDKHTMQYNMTALTQVQAKFKGFNKIIKHCIRSTETA